MRFESDRVWLERGGDAGEDLDDIDRILGAFEIDDTYVGFDASMLGGAPAALRPAVADAGFAVLIMPLADPKVLASLRAPSSLGGLNGVYCIAPLAPGRVKARFFAPGLGVSEDPATGGAAAALGLYLGARTGTLDVEIEQGTEIARPSFISLKAEPGKVRVGGQVHLASEGSLVG